MACLVAYTAERCATCTNRANQVSCAGQARPTPSPDSAAAPIASGALDTPAIAIAPAAAINNPAINVGRGPSRSASQPPSGLPAALATASIATAPPASGNDNPRTPCRYTTRNGKVRPVPMADSVSAPSTIHTPRGRFGSTRHT